MVACGPLHYRGGANRLGFGGNWFYCLSRGGKAFSPKVKCVPAERKRQTIAVVTTIWRLVPPYIDATGRRSRQIPGCDGSLHHCRCILLGKIPQINQVGVAPPYSVHVLVCGLGDIAPPRSVTFCWPCKQGRQNPAVSKKRTQRVRTQSRNKQHGSLGYRYGLP